MHTKIDRQRTAGLSSSLAALLSSPDDEEKKPNRKNFLSPQQTFSLLAGELLHGVAASLRRRREVILDLSVRVGAVLVHRRDEVRDTHELERPGQHEREHGEVSDLARENRRAQRRRRRRDDARGVVEPADPFLKPGGRLLDVVLEDVQVDLADAPGDALHRGQDGVNRGGELAGKGGAERG